MIKKGINWTIKEFQVILTRKCRDFLKKLIMWQCGGRNPFKLTGAIIYLADKFIAKEHNQKTVLTQKMISNAIKIAEYSIRDHYVNLLKPLFIK